MPPNKIDTLYLIVWVGSIDFSGIKLWVKGIQDVVSRAADYDLEILGPKS